MTSSECSMSLSIPLLPQKSSVVRPTRLASGVARPRMLASSIELLFIVENIRRDQGDMSLDTLVAKLAERMRAEPDNADGWVMLGRSYAALKRHREAADAYGKAYQLVGDNPGLMTDYADVLATANQGVFTDQAGELLGKSLAINSKDVKTLWLIGHFNYQRGHYPEAIGYWQRAATFMPEGDENAPFISL